MPDEISQNDIIDDLYNGFIVQRNNTDYFGTITEIGNTRMADAVFEHKELELIDFAVGDGGGQYVLPQPQMTKLVNEVHRVKADVKKDPDNSNIYYITGIIPVIDGGFMIREMGVFSKEGELIAVANAANIEKLTPIEGVFLCLEITIRIIIAHASAIKVTIDNDGITATKKDIEKHDKNPDSHDGHFKNTDIHLLPGERSKIYNQVIHFVATLPKSGWTRVGNTFDLEYTVPKELGITISKNMKPTVSCSPDTLMQIIDDEYQILCTQRDGKLTFHALVKPPETTFAIDVYLHRVDEKPEENNLHTSNVLGAETGDGTPLPKPVLNATVSDSSTNLELSTRGSWSNPTEDYAGTTVVRKRGSIPVDKDDGVLITSGNITSFTDKNSLELEVAYYYRFLTFNKAGHYQNEPYFITLTIPCKPSPGVTTFQVSDASTDAETRVKITLSNPVSVYYKETVIVRKFGNSEPTSVNDGVIIYRGQSSTIYDSDGLSSNNTYTWRAFTINKKGDATSSLSSNISLVPATAPQVSNTRLEDTSTDSGGYAVTARWVKNRSTTLDHIEVRLKEGGTVQSFTDGVRIYSGTGESVEYKTGIRAGGEYYVRAFAVNTAGIPNLDTNGATASCVVGGGTPGAITNFRGSDSMGTTTLTWNNPTGSSFWALTKIIMKIGSAPTSMTDGESVYSGGGTSIVLSNRQNGVTYHYAAFACNSAGQTSGNPSRCSVTPQLTPSNFTFLTCLTQNTAWQPPTDGAYRITCIGKCADGEDGVDAKNKYGCGRGGNGGGSGGISRSTVFLKASNRYNCTVDSAISSFESMLSATAAVGMEPGSGVGGTEFNVTGARGGAGGAGGTSKNWENRGKVGEPGGNNGGSPGKAYRSSSGHGDWGGGGSGGGGANYVLPDGIKYDDILYTKTQRSLSTYTGGNGFGYDGENREVTSGSSVDGGIINKPYTVFWPFYPTDPTPYPGLLASDPVFYGGGCGGGGSSTGFTNTGGLYIPDGNGGTIIFKDKFPTFGSLGTPGVILIEKGVF